MKQALVVIGGLRIGDTAHFIPFFDGIQDYEITWITGTYERVMVELIQSIYTNIKQVIYIDDGLPMGLDDRIIFRDKAKELHPDIYDVQMWDAIFDNFLADQIFTGYQLKDTYFPNERRDGGYIVYHLETISGWKNETQIRDLLTPRKGYSIGAAGNFVLPHTIDFTGRPLPEVVELISKCSLFVGLNSSMACLTFYINKPAIVVNFTDMDHHFTNQRKNFSMLINPTVKELKYAINDKLRDTAKQ